MPRQNTCANCVYFGEDMGEGGECRRYCPSGSNVREDRAGKGQVWLAVWPHVRKRDWCGEWKADAENVR